MSLLERHLRLLRNAGVDDIVLALGYVTNGSRLSSIVFAGNRVPRSC